METVDDANDELKAQLRPCSPMIGPFAKDWVVSHYPPSLKYWWKDICEGKPSAQRPSKPVLLASHHHSCTEIKPLPTLHERISQKEARWSPNMHFGVEFRHIPYYWEWLEDILRHFRSALSRIHLLDAVYASMFIYKCDSSVMQTFCESWCPLTNTVLLSEGEMSISLWDIHVLGGLPISGLLYDEVIPAKAFEESKAEHDLRLPHSCTYLFKAFRHITTKSNRSDFSAFGNPQPWGDTTHGALLDLDIPEAHRRETYLAAFLSCWICFFALPLKNQGHIRPGVFKPASYLASGHEISLAIPVLASIYRGMGELCISSSPGKHPGSFPAHFVYAWIASYFRSHRSTAHVSVGARMINFHGHEAALSFNSSEARSLIRSNTSISWLVTFVNRSRDEDFIDDNMQSRQTAELFLSMRSSFVTLRHDNCFVIQQYSRHRFSRQFGFYQDLPGELEIQKFPRQDRLFSLFSTSVLLGTNSSFLIPGRCTSVHARTTPTFVSWWKSVYSLTYSLRPSSPPDVSKTRGQSKLRKRKVNDSPSSPKEKAAKILIEPEEKRRLKVKLTSHCVPPLPREDFAKGGKAEKSVFDDIFGNGYDEESDHEETQDDQGEMDIAEELRACNNTFASPDQELIDASHDPVIVQTAACILMRESSDIVDVPPVSAKTPSQNVRDVISRAERHAASYMVQAIRKKLLETPLEEIHDLKQECEELFQYITSKGIDISFLQGLADKYIECGSRFRSQQKTHAEKPALSVLEQQLLTAESDLSSAVSRRQKEEERVRTLEGEMKDIHQNQTRLKAELAELTIKENNLVIAIADSKHCLEEHATTVKDLTTSHTSLEERVVDVKRVETELSAAKGCLDEVHEALKTLQWEP
ncbi:hypothetical protein BVRB_5g107930 [Beta vulgaris subsp. vulgaris]|nr:hypothetical protein BVRB_5g107930 [Beta vulgaris subsp. vulgaris]